MSHFKLKTQKKIKQQIESTHMNNELHNQSLDLQKNVTADAKFDLQSIHSKEDRVPVRQYSPPTQEAPYLSLKDPVKD
jgi:hypothetical protein